MRIIRIVLVVTLCLCAQIARAQSIERGVAVERVVCAGDASQSYALYLPSGYSPDRPWSVILAFHPAARGLQMVEKFRVISTALTELGQEPLRLLTDVTGERFWTVVAEARVLAIEDFFAAGSGVVVGWRHTSGGRPQGWRMGSGRIR